MGLSVEFHPQHGQCLHLKTLQKYWTNAKGLTFEDENGVDQLLDIEGSDDEKVLVLEKGVMLYKLFDPGTNNILFILINSHFQYSYFKC